MKALAIWLLASVIVFGVVVFCATLVPASSVATVATVSPTLSAVPMSCHDSFSPEELTKVYGPMTQAMIDKLYGRGICVNLASYSDVPYVPRYAEPTHR